MFTALNLLLLIGFLFIIGAAFFGRISKTISSILAVYLAAVCAWAFHHELTEVDRRPSTSARQPANSVTSS